MKAPSWQAIRMWNLVIVALNTPIVVLAGPSWIAMVDCVVIGALLASVYFVNHFIKMKAAFDEMSAVLAALSEINSHLINSHINNNKKPSLEPPDAPRIH